MCYKLADDSSDMCMQAAHAEICALQKSCDSLKATLKHLHAAHIAAEREVASLQQIRLDQVRLESSC